MTTISTLNLHSITTGAALNLETQLGQVQIQQSSGLVAQNFGTLGGSATSEMLNLQDNISQAQTWASEAQTVGSRTQSMYSMIGNMVTTVTSLQSQISQAMASPNNSGLLGVVQNLQKSLVSQMNTQYAGRYLFSGSDIGTAPVDMSNYPTVSASGAYDPSSVDTSYYTGDSNVLSVQVASQQTLSYGVPGNSPAFEQAMRAVEAVVQASSVTTGSSATASTASGASTLAGGTLVINGTTVTVAANESFSNVAAAINSQLSSSGVTARVVPDNSGNYHVQISGGNAALNITDSSGLGVSSASPLTQSQLNSQLSQALDLANQAVTGLSNLQASVAAVSKQLNDAQQQQTTYVTFLQNSLSNVKDADTAQVAAQVQALQTQLQASYMAVASVSKINLAQYL